jgi:methylenetetrahydrofolate dehydrogenase (NADP+) / methenyltetrahydrofolate cyclohydrolase
VTAALIDGKAFAAGLRARIKAAVPALAARLGRAPGLTVVIAGDDPASHVYVRNKGIAAKEVGFHSDEIRLPATVNQAELLTVIARLNSDPGVDGILVQLPLPAHISVDAVLDTLDPAKDVDGLTPTSAGLLASGRTGLVPCTPQGCLLLARDQGRPLAGLNAVVLGRSILVGKPVAQLLLAENCTVTIVHSRSQDLQGLVRRADILVAAVGKPGLVRGDWIKPGAVVIDVGINRVDGPDGKSRLMGDVAFDEGLAVAGAITPVPGGVGPMTIACLLRNTLLAAARRASVAVPLDV